MFFGAVPQKCIEQIFRICDFENWDEIYVCCSGGFRIERALLAKYPKLVIFSNDVSLFSTALGELLAGREIPITFKGPLEFLEDSIKPDDYPGRVAGVLIASDLSRLASGKKNIYKSKHLENYKSTLTDRLRATREKLQEMVKACHLAGFFPGDWRLHASRAIETGASIAAFPPFFKGDYEAMFKFLHANTDWPAPSYDVYDPRELEGIVTKMRQAGINYCVLSDQVFETMAPVMEYEKGNKVPHFCYASTGRSSLRIIPLRSAPFNYKLIDFRRLSAKTQMRFERCHKAKAAFIKDVYLQNTIKHTNGDFSYLIYLDDMLAGILIYSISKYRKGLPPGLIYLLSDTATSREGKISELVARVACCSEILDEVSVRCLNKILHVFTTARSKHPVSMKYRGIYELHNRHDPAVEGGEYVINYIGKRIPGSCNDVYRWWWTKWGAAEVAKTRNRNEAA